jgi:superfamily II DNA/RNA helicase
VDDSKDIPTAVAEQTPAPTTVASEEVIQKAFAERRTVTTFDCMSYEHLSDIRAQCVICRSEEFTAGMAPLLTPPTAAFATLYSQKFVNPTPIQSLTIPKALSGRDIIGIAETVRSLVFRPPCHAHFDV